MADLQNILAALAQQRQTGTPSQGPPPPMHGVPYPPQYSTAPTQGAPSYGLPQPINSGSVDLGGIQPVNSGSVSIADAIAKARGIAADKGVSYDPNRGMAPSKVRNHHHPNFLSAPSRNADPRMANRDYRRSRSPSGQPSRNNRDQFRGNANPYRDERRGGGGDRGYNRERSLSPAGRYSPAGYRDARSPTTDRGAEGDSEIVPIEKNMVGLVIGRAGENLRRVENTTGARVQFVDGPDVPGPQRHCKISGSRTARASAKYEIFKIIEDNELAKRGQDPARVQVAELTEATQEGDSLQVLVPDRTVGLIIGRGGETIRDLQERSGCHVNIVGENKSVNGFRPVNLIGSATSQQRAKDLIFEIVESDQKGISIKELHSQNRGREDPYNSKINDNIMVPGEAVGMIIGKGMNLRFQHVEAASNLFAGGETIREMQNASGCKINVSPASGRDIEREIGLIGTRQAIEAAKRAITEKVDAVVCLCLQHKCMISLLTAQQEARNRAQGGSDRGGNDYGDRYSAQPQPQPQQQQQQQQQQQHQQPAYSVPGIPQQAGASPAAGGADPYAAYGGYQAYMQMWYAALAAQQQQPGGQGPGEQR